MVTGFKYATTIGWTDDKISHKDDYMVGARTKKLLSNIDECVTMLKLLQEQVEEHQADSMDIYFDESNRIVFLTVKLFDEDEDLIKIFNIECSIQKQEFFLLLEFLEFSLNHDINVYSFKGRVADRINEYADEQYDLTGVAVNRRKTDSIKPR